jgi:hypothetical protein
LNEHWLNEALLIRNRSLDHPHRIALLITSTYLNSNGSAAHHQGIQPLELSNCRPPRNQEVNEAE